MPVSYKYSKEKIMNDKEIGIFFGEIEAGVQEITQLINQPHASSAVILEKMVSLRSIFTEKLAQESWLWQFNQTRDTQRLLDSVEQLYNRKVELSFHKTFKENKEVHQ